MKEVLFSNKEYSETLGQLDKLLQDVEQLSDVDHKVLVYQILQYFDSIHREPLSRIFGALKNYPTLKDQLIKDPTTSKLLSLYDIINEDQANNDKNGSPVAFIPESEVTLINPPKRRDWLELGEVTSFENKKLYPKNYERVNFLISRVDSDVFALQNQCDGSFLPIDQGTLEDHLLICPWHGCKYDIRTGRAIDEPNKKLETFPVEIEEGLVKVEIAY